MYAYSTADLREILYIGKVDGTTIRQRWNRQAKANFWNDLEKKRKIYKHSVFAGEAGLPPNARLSMELLADIESLLIKRIAPWGNIQSRTARISRPGLRVRCLGDWPLRKREFLDIGLASINL
ncbi:MAG: hypothetical protein HY611_05740 [Elusimicrobia bacterium]|nr:hypothetical protein [Elusimicrobiota bacterium]